MEINNLKYNKQDGVREILRESRESAPFKEEFLDTIDETISPDYQKGVPMVEVSRIFTVSGGAKRERQYLEQFKDAKRLSIIFISKEGQGLIPEEMVALTKNSVESGYFIDYYGQRRDYLAGDSIYLIQDVDHYGLELKTFYKNDKSQGIYRWIISNPCLEIWLYYHYSNDVKILEECESLQPKKRSSWLKKRIGEIVNGGISAKKTIDKTTIAISNAKSHLNFDEEGFPSLFTTEMYIPAEEILSVLKDDLAELVSHRTEFAKRQKELFEDNI